MTDAELERLRAFINKSEWVFAKTYAKTAPHEYVVKERLGAEDKKEFNWFVDMIFTYGEDKKFYSATYRYLYEGDYKYWVMDKEPQDVELINRADATQTIGQ